MANVWEQKREQINVLLKDLQQKPDREKRAYPLVAGGILNAYREGDVSFDDAVSQLCEWAIGYAAQQKYAPDSPYFCGECGTRANLPHHPRCSHFQSGGG